MLARIFCISLLSAVFLSGWAQAQNPKVWMDTDRGPIVIELDPVNAPLTTENFLEYVNAGFYDGLVFHRVFNDYIVEGGAFNRNLAPRAATMDPVPSEANNGLSNVEGTIAMANGGDPDAARAGFYFNVSDNPELDADYTVFGEIIMGHDTVQAIETAARHLDDENQSTSLPVSPTIIHRAVAFEGDFPIMPLHTGTWYDPTNPGVGFNVEVTNNATTEEGPLVVVYWYNFNDGWPMWLTGTSNFEYGATSVSVNLLGVTSFHEDADFQSPPDLNELLPVGTMTIDFEDCTHGSFSYDLFEFGSGDIDVTRLTLPDGESCLAF